MEMSNDMEKTNPSGQKTYLILIYNRFYRISEHTTAAITLAVQ
jgi:hypothetical protein